MDCSVTKDKYMQQSILNKKIRNNNIFHQNSRNVTRSTERVTSTWRYFHENTCHLGIPSHCWCAIWVQLCILRQCKNFTCHQACTKYGTKRSLCHRGTTTNGKTLFFQRFNLGSQPQ